MFIGHATSITLITGDIEAKGTSTHTSRYLLFSFCKHAAVAAVLDRAQTDIASGSNSSVMKDAAVVLVFYNDLYLRLVKGQ